MLQRERNLLERFFSRLKHLRRVATRYDKLAANFLARTSSPQSGFASALMILWPS